MNNHKESNLLISMDFRPGKGGIARVARLISRSMDFTRIYSLHGKKDERTHSADYFQKNRFLFVLSILKFIILRKPSLIVFDHLNIARLLTLLPQSRLKKVIIFLHDEEAWEKVTGLRRAALRKASHILCNSEYTRRKFLESNRSFAGKTHLCLLGGIPEGFDQREITSENKFASWLNDARPYCLFVSRLWRSQPYKGHFELLKAFEAYYRENKTASIRLVIVGNGDAAEEVAHSIKDTGLNDRVTLFTGVDDAHLALFYKNAECFLFPSTREGFGLVYLEAMYFGKACIGIAGQPAEEIIVDHKTGRLLPDNSPETLARVIKDVEENRSRYKEWGANGKERYMQYFTGERFAQRFLEIVR